MPDYRRNRVAGGTYFFTLALADRRSGLLVQEVAALRASVSRARALYPFSIDAWVVLQRRFWEHTIRDEADFTRHVDDVHFNPVKHGLVANAKDW